MRICIPTTGDDGVEARVSGHFGRAPFFTLVDTATDAVESVPNPGHGAGHPPDFVLRLRPDAVAVRGLGRGAYDRFRRAGVELFRTEETTVGTTVEAARAGRLEPLTEGDVHAGGHHGGHDHHHGAG